MKGSLLLLLGIWSLGALAADLRLAVAANFMPVVQAIAPAFERQTGHRLLLSAGASGRFYTQIVNGGTYDVLLSADVETPARLHAEGLAGVPFTYAIGRLALWSPRAGAIDAAGRVLSAETPLRLAIANPKSAPYGQAALQTLERLGLAERYRARLIQGESVGQAFQFVASGAVDAGFVALSQIWRHGQLTGGSAWIVPDGLHAPLRQDATLLRRSTAPAAAQAFLDYLRTPEVRATLTDFGYGLP